MSTHSADLAANQLSEMELFDGLPAEALVEVAAAGRARAVKRGTVLFTQGAPASRCHALTVGRVRITQSGESGGQLIVRLVGPREMFGTMALFTDRCYPAEAVAITDSIEISWTEPALLGLIHRYPQIALNLVRIAGVRLREVQQRLRELATESVDRRIAHALLRLVGHDDGRTETEIAIDFPLTRADLAAMCGATLYTASRVLKAWERAGYLVTRRRLLSIRNLAELERIAGGSNPSPNSAAQQPSCPIGPVSGSHLVTDM